VDGTGKTAAPDIDREFPAVTLCSAGSFRCLPAPAQASEGSEPLMKLPRGLAAESTFAVAAAA
jgi:hypothetical protein